MTAMKIPAILSAAQAALLLLPWGCSAPGRLPEGEVPPRLALPAGSLVLVEARSAPGASLGGPALAVLAETALTQSPRLDFLVLQEGDPPPRLTPAAKVLLSWEPLPGSPFRWRIQARAERLSDEKKVRLQAAPRGKDLLSAEAALDSMARILRRTLGETPASILSHQVPLSRAFTAEPAALEDYLAARRLVRKGRIPQAGLKIQAALSRDPRFGKALLLLASLLLDGGAPDRALQVLERAAWASLQMTASDRHVLARLRLRGENKFQELLEEAGNFLREYPYSPEGLFTKGLALNHLGRFRAALPIWRGLHRRRPGSLTPLFQLGAAQFGLGRYDQAARLWDRLAEFGAPPLQAAFFAALPRIASGRAEEALRKVEEIQRRAPRRAALQARFHLMLCALSLLAGQVPRADREARAVLEASKADPAATRSEWTLAGRYLLYRGRVAPLREFLKILPLARPAGRLEDLRLAGLWLQGLAAAKDPGNTLADRAASTLSQEGRPVRASTLLAEIAKARANPPARIFNLRKALAGYPSPWNEFLLAQALLEEGKTKEGRALLERILSRGLSLDLNNIHLHPAANPLSAAALVEARRILAERKGRR